MFMFPFGVTYYTERWPKVPHRRKRGYANTSSLNDYDHATCLALLSSPILSALRQRSM